MPKKTLASQPRDKSLTPAETARYTSELLESLRKISLQQGQILLAHFLELAAFEARTQAANQAQETRLPE